MESRDAVAALAKLLADPAAIELFGRDREAAAQSLRLDAESRTIFWSWDVEQLRRQARCLVDKRRHEAARFLPRTFQRLGTRGESLFTEFSATHWPTGHRRHAADALAFSRWLRAARDPAWCAQEHAPLQLLFSRCPFALRVVRKFASRRGSRLALVLLVRIKGRIRSCALYLA